MSTIAATYAQGLYSLAKEEDLTQLILSQLRQLDEIFSHETEYIRLLAAPDLPKQERCALADESLRGQVHPYVLNFIKILIEKGYICHFCDCCHAYSEQYNADNGIVQVIAATAVPLTQAQTQKLTDKLCALTQKTIDLKNRIDPAVLGGVRLDYSSTRVDGTIRSRLDAIGALLKNTVL